MIMSEKFVASLLLAGQGFVWMPAMAQNTLTVPIEVVRISNPGLVTESPGSVTLYRLNPQYTLRMVQDSSRTELSLGGLIERSSNTDLSASRTLPSVGLLWERSTPVAVLQLRASLEEASTRETEFAEFGRVTRDSTQRTGVLGGQWTRELEAGTSLELATSYLRVSYDTPFLVAYNEARGTVTYRFDSSPNARYALTASVARLNPDGSAESASRGGVGLGYEIDLSEGLTLSATAGAVRTTALSRKTHPVGFLRLTYLGERVRSDVGWSRDVSASGTVGGYVRSENVDGSMIFPFTADTSLSVGIGHARSLGGVRDATASANVRILSELTRFWMFTIGLEHRRSMPSGLPTAQGNAVALGLIYSRPGS